MRWLLRQRLGPPRCCGPDATRSSRWPRSALKSAQIRQYVMQAAAAALPRRRVSGCWLREQRCFWLESTGSWGSFEHTPVQVSSRRHELCVPIAYGLVTVSTVSSDLNSQGAEALCRAKLLQLSCKSRSIFHRQATIPSVSASCTAAQNKPSTPVQPACSTPEQRW